MISTPLIVFTKQSLWLANYKDKKGIYIKKYKIKDLMWSRQNRGDFAPKSHEQYKVRNSHLHGLVRNSHLHGIFAWTLQSAKFAILSSLYEWQYTIIGTWFVSNSKTVSNMGFLKGDFARRTKYSLPKW